jgi:Protein of unknown function (DUF2934)
VAKRVAREGKTAPIAKQAGDTVKSDSTIEQIRKRAYELYTFRDGRAGDALGDWLEAEREVLAKQR